jgi:hypothetical protein
MRANTHGLKAVEGPHGASLARQEAMALRLVKGKGAGAPIFNGGEGLPPGPPDTDDEFSDTTRASQAHAATSPVGVDHNPHGKMDRFISAMTPSVGTPRHGK